MLGQLNQVLHYQSNKMAEKNKKQEEKETQKKESGKENEKKTEKKKEKQELKPKDKAVARGVSLRLSLKNCIGICKMLRGKTPEKGIERLEQVIKRQRSIQMRSREVAHQKSRGRKNIAGPGFIII